ncbi:MAG: ATP-binding cassette domain-containing protein, partial [Coriobacteriia bacterium]|nr:ATP-binding cassette domain-containing protein [Coriobacteriia bacterium]
NGAGKSTLLKLATGVAFPTSGEVEINGNIAALLELKAGFASDLTGRENIYLKGYILGCTKEEIATMESDIIEFAELGEYIDQPLRTYSSGMKVRLGFAVNVNTNPDILIVDEALSVGDKYFKAKCNNKIRSLVDSGVTVLFVSHSMNAVKEICERVIYLKKGRIVFDGPSKEAIAIYGKSKK